MSAQSADQIVYSIHSLAAAQTDICLTNVLFACSFVGNSGADNANKHTDTIRALIDLV